MNTNVLLGSAGGGEGIIAWEPALLGRGRRALRLEVSRRHALEQSPEVLPTAAAATAPRMNDSAAAATITRRRLVLGFCNRAPSSAGIVWNCMMNGWPVLNEGELSLDARERRGFRRAVVLAQCMHEG